MSAFRSPRSSRFLAGIALSVAWFWLSANSVQPQANPLYNPSPSSTLLRPGSTQVTLTVNSLQPTQCRYYVGKPLKYEQMKPFTIGQGKTTHKTTIGGLSPNAGRINDVYVRCASQKDFLLHLQYRSLPRVNPHFPRTGNLWGSDNFLPKGLTYCSRIDLWLGPDFTADQVRQLRGLNSNSLFLTTINAVENNNLSDDYYLKDVNGNRIEVWPGGYLLNLTKSYVADYQARYAYQRVLDTGLMVDGCFFDHFITAPSYLKSDIYGNPVRIDANEDGVEDDPAWLDATWWEGVLGEIRVWRTLMPYAFASGHLAIEPGPDVAGLFNGDNIGFMTAEVLDGRRPFNELWDEYQNRCKYALKPVITMIESAPQNQISYGYDYDPLAKIPPSTLEFARTFYPYMRFGLALTLMNDGYFAHEFGDTDHGQDWWYDELDFNLGSPAGQAKRISIAGEPPNPNLIENGSFELPIEGTWEFWVNTGAGCEATVERDIKIKAKGTASAKITITQIGPGVDWYVSFNQAGRSIAGGQAYDLTFWAKASSEGRLISLSAQKGVADWRNYGLGQRVALGTTWKQYTVTFTATETASDARFAFYAGNQAGTVWLDDVNLTRHPLDIYRRDFTNGIVFLNGTTRRLSLPLGKTYYYLKGDQAARHQYIVDDSGAGFTATGSWENVTIDSGEWRASGPFYHDWGAGCRRLASGQTGSAEWDLALVEDDTYTIQAWWPGGPDSSGRGGQIIYEIISGGSVIASIMVNQTIGGDEWHTIATIPLFVSGAPKVRVRNGGSGTMIADAIHIFSAKRLNDGKALTSVTVGPQDGVILRKTNPH